MNALVEALEQIKRWMFDHDAPLLVENLAPGATAQELSKLEQQFGFSLPAELKALWSHHHGQVEEMNGFVEWMDLFDGSLSLAERDTVDAALDLLRGAPDALPQAGLTTAECDSKRWVPFAGRDSNVLVVNVDSARVFVVEKDWPPIRLVANTLTEWAQAFAAKVQADDFTVEEGFGDYHLAPRNRVAEAHAIERERRRAQVETYERETPLLQQLRDALEAKNDDRSRELFEALTPEALPGGIDLLFAAGLEPRFIATSLQFVLRTVTLDASQWRLVIDGGRALGNEAIVAVATEAARAGG